MKKFRAPNADFVNGFRLAHAEMRTELDRVRREIDGELVSLRVELDVLRNVIEAYRALERERTDRPASPTLLH
jgi:hypothetical protein